MAAIGLFVLKYAHSATKFSPVNCVRFCTKICDIIPRRTKILQEHIRHVRGCGSRDEEFSDAFGVSVRIIKSY